MALVADWWKQTRGVYFDNATSVRDYRVQLRGNRSVLLFGVYLVVLIGVAMLQYTQSANLTGEVVEIQARLRGFYDTIMALLGGLVSLIAPALTATTVVTERQRRSLDLVFSAPVTPRYFLVGKMISSYRYTVMLLTLSLPITAACVVLGGASWTDVLTSYLMLSLLGIIFTAIGLLMSTMAVRPVSAVVWSYAASLAYIILTLIFSSAAVALGMRGGKGELPLYACLNPFLVQQTSATHMTIGSMPIPNWILVGIVAGLASKILLLGAGSILSPRPEVEIRSLRMHALVYTITYMLIYGSSGRISLTMVGGHPHMDGYEFFELMSPLFLFIPHLSAFGVDQERRYWPNGLFSFRHLWDGTPAGNLPFLLVFLGGNALALGLGLAKTGVGITTEGLIWIFYTIAFWVLMWSIGRCISSTFPGLRAARMGQFSVFVLLIVIPYPFISAMVAPSGMGNEHPLWKIYALHPILDSKAPSAVGEAMMWGVLMTALAIILIVIAQAATRSKMALLEKRYA